MTCGEPRRTIFVRRLRPAVSLSNQNSIGLIPRKINSAYGCLMDNARIPLYRHETPSDWNGKLSPSPLIFPL